MNSNHSGSLSNKQKKKANALRSTAGGRTGSGGLLGQKIKQQKKGSPIMQKLTSLFRRERNTENGHVPVRPSCFADSPERRRSESPEPSASNRKRSTSLNNLKLWKTTGKSESGRGPGVGWRPKGRQEWESDSGRQITLPDVSVNELSKVEMQALQRLAITTLQGMDIPVSHGLLRGSRNVLQRLSFNSFKQRKVNGNERVVDGLQGSLVNSSVFGQPLNQIISQDQPSKSGVNTPVPSTPTGTIQRNMTSTSPTSLTSSEASFIESEIPTTTLLEALSISPSYYSPKTKRRMSLCRAEPQVPNIVTKAINYLDTKGVKTEGLFRIPGAKSRINEIREKFDSGQDVELTDDMNPHDVACLLKEFFRSLPEPLMTLELFGPFLATRKLSSSAQRRDALRLLCLLLPPANRDTLQELLQFLSRVALHSDGIILIDGTEEVGNRMTEQNLAMIVGPNILHKEIKRKSVKTTDYQVQKQDPDELSNVCKVMEDLIRMHLSIFVIPAQLYDMSLRPLMTSDPTALDLLLKRRCYEQRLYLDDESPTRGLVSRSRSTEALRKISHTSVETSMTLEQELLEQEYMWQRTHSLSDTQKVLDEAIRNLEDITEDLANPNHHRHYSSNDSAMGGSEAVVSPVQSDSAYSEPSTLNRKRHQVFDSMDSAFSNNSSPTNSSEGVHQSGLFCGETNFIPCNHIRMSSEASNTSTGSPVPGPEQTTESPGGSSSDVPLQMHIDRKAQLSKVGASSLPVLSTSERTGKQTLPDQHMPKSAMTLPSQPTQPKQQSSKQAKKRSKHKTQPPLTSTLANVGKYSHQRSPILSYKDDSKHQCQSDTQLDNLSSDHTPTESSTNITSSPSGYSLDSSHLHGKDTGTII